MHAYQDLMNDFDWAAKSKQHVSDILRVRPKNEENFLKKCKKSFRFFNQNLYGKLTVFTIFY